MDSEADSTTQMNLDFFTEGADMNEVEEVAALLRFVQVGARVLSYRVALMLALTLTFALFGWAMANPDAWRFAGATVFGLLVFLPTVWLDFQASKGD